MKILIDDGMQIKVGTGIGQYTKYLFYSLKNEDVEVDLAQYDKMDTSKIVGRLKYLLHINSFSYYKKCRGYDVVHFTNYTIPHIRNRKSKYVVTIHDLASYLYSETMPKIHRKYGQFVARYAIKHSDEIITVSNSVKNEIIHLFPEYSDKITVIYPGHYFEIKRTVDQELFTNDKLKNLKDKKFFLFIGTLEKRKNIGMILDSFFKLKSECKNAVDYQLVLAGRAGYEFEEINITIEKSCYKDDIILPGFITKGDCNLLYHKACAYVFPTVYEGFGSTQLECMTCYTPLILSDIPTNREVSKDYGLYFNLNQPQELLIQMKAIVSDNYDYAEKKSLADRYIMKFDWNTRIGEYLEVYARRG